MLSFHTYTHEANSFNKTEPCSQVINLHMSHSSGFTIKHTLCVALLFHHDHIVTQRHKGVGFISTLGET